MPFLELNSICNGGGYHADVGIDESEGEEGVAADSDCDGKKHKQDIAPDFVDHEAEKRWRHGRNDVHDAVDGVGVARGEVEFTLEEHSAIGEAELMSTNPFLIAEKQSNFQGNAWLFPLIQSSHKIGPRLFPQIPLGCSIRLQERLSTDNQPASRTKPLD